MKDTIALIIPAISLFVYIVLSSIEFGASLFSVFPALMKTRDAVRDYMNPLWETTTIFLAFSLISLFSFFPGATTQWTTDLFPLLFGFLAVMGARIICILLLHYGDVRSRIIRVLYFVSSMASATVGALVLLYFLVGSRHVTGPVRNWLIALSMSGALYLASAFFRAYARNPKLTQLVRFVGTIFYVSATFFMLSLLHTYPYFLQSYSGVGIPSVLIVCIVVSVYAEAHRAYRAACAVVLISFAALYWGLFAAHLPFIVYPTVTIAASVTDSASFNVLAACFGVGIVFVIPALILLYKLFIFGKKERPA